jgi:hypothetical protein
MKKVFTLAVLCAFGLGGCALAVKDPTLAELDAADYGMAPENPQDQAMAYLKETLFDPMSAVVEWQDECVKGWWRWYEIPGNLFSSSKLYFGWKLNAKVNAKNRMGGYVGFKIYTFCFRDGKLLHVFTS